MWSELTITHGLLLAVLTTLLLPNTIMAKAEHTTALTNVSSSVITEPYLKASPSAVSTYPKDLPSTKLIEMKKPLLASEAVAKVSETKVEITTRILPNVKKASAITMPHKKRNTIHTLIIVPQTHSVSVQTKSALMQPGQQAGSLKEGEMTRTTIQPKVVSSIASFEIPGPSSVVSVVRGKMNDTVSENKMESKTAMKSATPEILPSHGKTRNLNIIVTIASQSYDTKLESSIVTEDDVSNMSYTKIKASAVYSVNKTVSDKLSIQLDASTNRTVFLHPSPSSVAKHNTSLSNINSVFTKAARNMTKLTPSGNYTTVQHSIIKDSFLLGYNHTMRINATNEKWPDRTSSKSDVFYPNTTKAMQTKVNVAATVYSTTIITSSSSLDLFSKTFNNETENLKRLKTYQTIRPSSSLSLPSKAVMNSTRGIQKPSSISVGTKIDVSKLESSHSEVKPTTTSLYTNSATQYSIPSRPTSAPIKLKEQQFLCTIKITSEVFKDEYITSARAFRQKSREVAEQFDQVFKNMPEYLYTDVLRLFKGSLGCDVIIHTESVDSQPVQVKKINDILHQAKNTKGGFGKFEVGDIDVKEKEPDVQGRDENDKSKTWGGLPIIIISVLGGVCLVLLVIVISQCVSKINIRTSVFIILCALATSSTGVLIL